MSIIHNSSSDDSDQSHDDFLSQNSITKKPPLPRTAKSPEEKAKILHRHK